MFELKQSGRTCSDEMAPYAVILDKEYTVREFVQEVLKRNEWGYIGIWTQNLQCVDMLFGKPKCEYRYGQLLSKLPDNILPKQVVAARASGGWSRMDYLLTIS